MADVFVSYAAEDRDRVRLLVEHIERTGISVWWDRNLRVGSFFERVIDHEIRRARAVVVVWTRNSARSHWVIGEAMAGLTREILLPVILDDVDVPLPFNARHTAQLLGWPVVASAQVDAFLAAVKEMLANHPATADDGASSQEVLLATSRPSVAVLPFEGADSRSTQVGEAIAAEVTTALSCFSSLEVVPRRTAFAPRLRNLDVGEISQLLEAQYVVNGHVRGSDRWRVLVELSDGVTNKVLWSRSFEAPIDDVGELEMSIAEAIAREMGGEFLRSEILASFSPSPHGVDLWALVHQARRHFITFNAQSLAQSRMYAEHALELAPDDPNALAMHASICAEACINGYAEFDAARTAALASMHRAIEQAPLDSVVLKYCGTTASNLGDQSLAIQLLRRSIEINPYDAGAWGYLGGALAPHADARRTDEALDILSRTIKDGIRHPGRPFWHHHVCVANTCRGQFEEAVRAARTAVELQPGLSLTWWHLANAYGELGSEREAADAAERAAQVNPAMTAEVFAALMRRTATSDSAYRRRTSGVLAILNSTPT